MRLQVCCWICNQTGTENRGKVNRRATRVYPGDIGTKGGVLTDTDARVLHEDGHPIAGLYATGNCSSAVMGETYPGPGATIGPSMTFGYAAVQHMLNRPV